MMQRLLQFTLDLFERSADEVLPVPRPSPKRARKPVPQRLPKAAQSPAPDATPLIEPTSLVGPVVASGLGAPSPGGDLPPQTLQQALAPATFRHPRAAREAMLGSVLVAYAFRRGKRRTIGFTVGPDGLAVSAPSWVPLMEVDKAVRDKSDWILKKLQETRARGQRLDASRIDWADGCTLPFLGEPLTVVLDAHQVQGGAGAELQIDATGDAGTLDTGGRLLVGLPRTAGPEQIRDAVQAWLMRQAKRIFLERLTHFAPTVGVQWQKLSLSSAGTRWGSASSSGAIRLNWRLVHFRLPVIDYVVVHELSHLRVMDHSPRFWDTVRAVVPDYAQLRSQLKDDSVPRW